MITTHQEVSNNHTPAYLRFFSSIVSVVFHPLFIPLYITYYLSFINPEFFTGMEIIKRRYVLVWVFINTFFFPALSVLLLKGVGFIDSIYLKNRRDRIIPYIAANLFYFWMFMVFHHNSSVPLILTSFVLGIFLTSSVALIANIYFKISMHAMGMGGAIGVLLVILFMSPYPTGVPLALIVTLLLSGIVCSSRLLISDHTSREIYVGLITGILFQIISAKCLF